MAVQQVHWECWDKDYGLHHRMMRTTVGDLDCKQYYREYAADWLSYLKKGRKGKINEGIIDGNKKEKRKELLNNR